VFNLKAKLVVNERGEFSFKGKLKDFQKIISRLAFYFPNQTIEQTIKNFKKSTELTKKVILAI